MGDLKYWIYSGSQPVTDATNGGIDDVEEAKRVAQELSTKQSDATIAVVSRVVETPLSEWTGTVARYRNGYPVPRPWKVDFHGFLLDIDAFHLSEAGIVYQRGESEIRDGMIRPGVARHEVRVEADTAEEAEQKVREALGHKANEIDEWHVEPA